MLKIIGYVIVFFGIFLLVPILQRKFTIKITKNNIEKRGNKIKNKLKINAKIDFKLNKKSSVQVKIPNKKYIVNIKKGSKEAVLLHELYHIKFGHSEKWCNKQKSMKSTLYNLFYDIFLINPSVFFYYIKKTE